MAGLSIFLADELYDHVFRNQGYTAPATLYVALIGTTPPTDSDDGSSIDEITNLGYARQAVTFGAPTNGAGSNDAEVVFGPAGENWTDVVTYFAIVDSPNVGQGEVLGWGQLSTPRQVNNGESLRFQVGDLDVDFNAN